LSRARPRRRRTIHPRREPPLWRRRRQGNGRPPCGSPRASLPRHPPGQPDLRGRGSGQTHLARASRGRLRFRPQSSRPGPRGYALPSGTRPRGPRTTRQTTSGLPTSTQCVRRKSGRRRRKLRCSGCLSSGGTSWSGTSRRGRGALNGSSLKRLPASGLNRKPARPRARPARKRSGGGDSAKQEPRRESRRNKRGRAPQQRLRGRVEGHQCSGSRMALRLNWGVT